MSVEIEYKDDRRNIPWHDLVVCEVPKTWFESNFVIPDEHIDKFLQAQSRLAEGGES